MPRETPTYALLPCALCQFEIASGDDIVIGSFPCYRGLTWNPKDEEAQATLRQSINETTSNSYRYPSFGVFRCFHSACLDMVDLEDELYLLRFVEAMRYKRQPNLLQKEMRRHHLITCLSAGLLESFAQQGTHLPLELWNKIAEHLLPHYASANARSLWRRIKPEPVRMTEDIWCKYVDFEGIRYITKLSNSPSDGWELIYRPSGESIKYIFTAENHLGVISLLFSTSSNEPQVDEAPGIWWRTVHVKGEDLALRERIDGIKLRYFSGLPRGTIAWSVPKPNKVRFQCLDADFPEKFPPYMSSLVCNLPSVTGYSVLWAGCIINIHAHRGIEDWTCYQSATTGSWLYMPIDPGEVIIEIWERRGYQPRQRAIGFKTSLGRAFIAGIYCGYLYGRPRSWSLVDRPGQTRMFFEDSERGITMLAFESQRPMGPNLAFPPLLPSVEDPVPTHFEDYFFSSHCLSGLVRVTPCKIGNIPGIAGMLLHFSNGHQESVGQVRLDCLYPPISLDDSVPWYMAFQKTDDNERPTYLAAISVAQIDPISDFEKVLQLSCEGRLEWFWSSRHCYAIYNQPGVV